MKRFWKDVTVEAGEAGFLVLLDGRNVRTPGRELLAVPGKALAQRLADEWAAQEDEVDPASMPFTGLANAALDIAEMRRSEIVDTIAGYAETDLLCYRADAPAELCALQAEKWQPLLDWAADTVGARLVATEGIIPVVQDPEALAATRARVEACDGWSLTGLSVLTQTTGSVVLGLAVLEDRISAEEAFALSQLDETWQESKWGMDLEASQRREGVKAQVMNAAEFAGLCRV